MKKTKKVYARPQLFVHGSVEQITLGSQGPHDPKPYEGNDGCGIGIGNGYNGRLKHCATS
jgi:hypothetical protein